MKKIFFVFLLFYACTKTEVPTVAVILPLSGKYSIYGKNAKAGVEFFLKKNKETSFKVKIYDFKSDSNTLKNILINTIIPDTQNICIIGPLTTEFTLFASLLCENEKIPLISPTATGSEIVKNKKWTFKMSYSDEHQSRILAKFVRDYIGLEKAGIMFERNPYSESLKENFKRFFEEKKGKIVVIEEFEEEDLSSKIELFKKSSPHFIFAPLYPEKAIKFVKSCLKRNLTTVFIGGDSWYSEEIINSLGKYADKNLKVYISSPFYPEKNTFTQEFEVEYGRKPDFISVLVYDALSFISSSLDKVKNTSRKKVRDIIEEQEEFKGVGGIYRFKGHEVFKEVWILKLEREGFKTLVRILPE